MVKGVVETIYKLKNMKHREKAKSTGKTQGIYVATLYQAGCTVFEVDGLDGAV